jgi:hypothetical protein
MHDFLSSYLGFENCLHTFCKSHLMRELVFLFEQHDQSWAKERPFIPVRTDGSGAIILIE